MIPNIKTIVYASDISAGSRPAFRAAVSLAQAYGAEIVFLHVMEPLPEGAYIMVRNVMGEKEMDRLHDEGVDYLKKTMHERMVAFFNEEMEGIETTLNAESVKYQLAEGRPYEEILKTAADTNADLIVMGTRKHHKFTTMGSVALKVLHHAECPVHIVPL
ncbi:universal stress protein [Oceanobacter mangrovi]|uniref:universal stress protein n=1 Tax=Oceanobacter mangrovi TaxID=2862510 RepID=UPI001C8D4BD1|nr:universal stress protein [Oceanobacter mangrovi]